MFKLTPESLRLPVWFSTHLRESIFYLIFGALTTGINFIVFLLLTNLLSVHYLVSNLTAWFLSVLFAYFTNRKYVFRCQTKGFIYIGKEMLLFFGSRGFTGAVDMLLMYLWIDIISLPNSWAKACTCAIVITLNYIFSKVLVFKTKGDDSNASHIDNRTLL